MFSTIYRTTCRFVSSSIQGTIRASESKVQKLPLVLEMTKQISKIDCVNLSDSLIERVVPLRENALEFIRLYRSKPKEISLTTRVGLAGLLVRQGLLPDLVAFNFKNLGLLEASVAVRLQLVKDMIQSKSFNNLDTYDHVAGAVQVVSNFDDFNLKDLPVSSRIELVQMIIDRGHQAINALAWDVDKFDLKEASPSDLLALYWKIAEKGEIGARYLALYFEKFMSCFGEIETSTRFNLAIAIARYENSAIALVENIDKFQLATIPLSDSLKLAFEIVSRGAMAESSFLKNSHKAPFNGLVSQMAIETSLLRHLVEAKVENSLLASRLKIIADEGANLDRERLEEMEGVLFQTDTKLLFVNDLIKQAKSAATPFIRFQQIQWLSYTVAILEGLPAEKISAIQDTSLLSSIQHYSNPRERYTLVRMISGLDDSEIRQISHSVDKIKWWRDVVRIPLQQMGGFGHEIRQIIDDKFSALYFKDTKKVAVMMHFLSQLNTIKDLDEEKSAKIISYFKTIVQKPKREMIGEIQALSNILMIFKQDEFFKIDPQGDYKALFVRYFKTLFTFQEPVDFAARYQETFGSFRDNMAIFTYLNTIQMLSKPEKKRVQTLLNTFVDSVLNGTFLNVRYDTAKSVHLAKVFSDANLKCLWQENGQSKPIVIETTATQERDFRKFFIEKFKDNHLSADKFPALSGYLNESIQETADSFQELSIKLIEKKIALHDYLREVEALQLNLGEFQNDLNGLKPKKLAKSYTISETDAPCDLLLIGTEVRGSCQRVNGDPSVNKCLGGYLMNGEVKALVIKDEKGVISARCLIRLLLDEKNDVPVLFLERLYQNVENPAFGEAILALAKAKAKAMGLSLLCFEAAGEAYPGRPVFLGSEQSPFVYTDAGPGAVNGKEGYQIYQSYLII